MSRGSNAPLWSRTSLLSINRCEARRGQSGRPASRDPRRSRRAAWSLLAAILVGVVGGAFRGIDTVHADSSVTVSSVSGTFYPYSGSGAFDTSQLSNSVFTQQFPVVDFNPNDGGQSFCSNSTGVSDTTRPFTDVVPNSDGTCSPVQAQGGGQQAGSGSLNSFEASFTGNLTVGSAGKVTFSIFSDDGWILGFAPVNGGFAQPTYISGALNNAPSATPVDGYAVVGAVNQGNSADTNQVSVYFPAAGTYPLELDYTECCGGPLALTLGTSTVTPWIQITPTALPGATEGQSAYSQTLTATGGSGTITWSLQSGSSLPSGFTLSSGGVISGTAGSTPSSTTFTVVATDANGATGTRQYTLVINPPPTITTTSLASGVQGESGYAQTLAATGGSAPITWSLQSGSSLPSGLSLSSAGVISGDLASNAVSSTFTVVATDANGFSATQQLTIAVGPAPGRNGSDLYGPGYDPASAAAPPCMSGDPVNCDTGNLVESVTDLQVAGRGRPLNLSRTYNSFDAAAAVPGHRFGFGWADSYSASLSFNPTTPQQAIVHTEDGSTIRFQATGGGGWTPVGPWVIAMLVTNGNGTYTYTLPNQTSDVFSSAGLPLSESDRDGYSTTLTYSAGRLTGVADPAGRTLTFTYGTNGLVSSAGDSSGRAVHYGYDASGNLTSVTDASGSVTLYGYDAQHRLASMTRPNGGVTTNVFDGANRVMSQKDPLGHITTFAYGSETTTITDPKGNVTVETYRSDLLTSLVKGVGTPQQATWTYGYDTAGHRIAVSDPNGVTSTATYDGAGDLLTSTNGLHYTTAYTYDALNDLTSVTDPLGHVTTITRDPVGHPLAVSQVHTEDGKVVSTAYTYGDPAHPGDVTAVTDADGKSSSYAYDAAGDLIRSADPVGDVTTYGYNAIGWRTSQTAPLGNVSGGNPAQHTSTTTYDGVGDVLTTTDPLLDQTTNVYDADHNLVKVTDANGHLTKYVYDLADEQTEVDRADGSVQKTSYDSDAEMASQIDGLGHATVYTYDPLRRVATVTDPLNRTTAYGYDGAGNQTNVTDPTGRTTSMLYDPAHELTNIYYSDGLTPNVVYTYDADGRRQTMADGTGTSTYQYDSLGRMVQSTDGNANGTGAHVVTYAYDLAGRTVGLTYPAQLLNSSTGGQSVVPGGTVSHGYDAAGRMTSITDWLGNTTKFGYDADGNMTGENYPNGVTTALSYDAADQLTRSTSATSGAPFLDLPYTRDHIGQVTFAIPLGTSPGVAQSYAYDPANRLVGTAMPVGPASVPNTTYAYDAADHLTSITTAGVLTTRSLGYDAADELLSSTGAAGTTSLSYDRNGNRATRTDPQGHLTRYGFDQANRLTSYVGPAMSAADAQIQSGAAALGGQTGSSDIQVDYSYNGDGLRMGKGASSVIPDLYAWDVAEGQPQLLQDALIDYVTDPSGLPLEQVQVNGTVLYYHHDQLGSTRALSDAHGLVVATYAYDPYGNAVGTPPAVANPFQYAGQYKDVETGLYYLRARYYEPSTDQFLSRDPLTSRTRSPYGYVDDNPVNATDPTGMIDKSYLSQDQVNQVNAACSGWQRQSLCTQAAFCAEWTAGLGSQSGGSCSAIGQIVVDNYNILQNALAHPDACGNVTLLNGYVESQAAVQQDVAEMQAAYQVVQQSIAFYNTMNSCKAVEASAAVTAGGASAAVLTAMGSGGVLAAAWNYIIKYTSIPPTGLPGVGSALSAGAGAGLASLGC